MYIYPTLQPCGSQDLQKLLLQWAVLNKLDK